MNIYIKIEKQLKFDRFLKAVFLEEKDIFCKNVEI